MISFLRTLAFIYFDSWRFFRFFSFYKFIFLFFLFIKSYFLFMLLLLEYICFPFLLSISVCFWSSRNVSQGFSLFTIETEYELGSKEFICKWCHRSEDDLILRLHHPIFITAFIPYSLSHILIIVSMTPPSSYYSKVMQFSLRPNITHWILKTPKKTFSWFLLFHSAFFSSLSRMLSMCRYFTLFVNIHTYTRTHTGFTSVCVFIQVSLSRSFVVVVIVGFWFLLFCLAVLYMIFPLRFCCYIFIYFLFSLSFNSPSTYLSCCLFFTRLLLLVCFFFSSFSIWLV